MFAIWKRNVLQLSKIQIKWLFKAHGSQLHRERSSSLVEVIHALSQLVVPFRKSVVQVALYRVHTALCLLPITQIQIH